MRALIEEIRENGYPVEMGNGGHWIVYDQERKGRISSISSSPSDSRSHLNARRQLVNLGVLPRGDITNVYKVVPEIQALVARLRRVADDLGYPDPKRAAAAKICRKIMEISERTEGRKPKTYHSVEVAVVSTIKGKKQGFSPWLAALVEKALDEIEGKTVLVDVSKLETLKPILVKEGKLPEKPKKAAVGTDAWYAEQGWVKTICEECEDSIWTPKPESGSVWFARHKAEKHLAETPESETAAIEQNPEFYKTILERIKPVEVKELPSPLFTRLNQPDYIPLSIRLAAKLGGNGNEAEAIELAMEVLRLEIAVGSAA